MWDRSNKAKIQSKLQLATNPQVKNLVPTPNPKNPLSNPPIIGAEWDGFH